MLEYLKIENVGPAPLLDLELAPRLNLITGDNGLGKTFLLDALWFSSTGSWPIELNPKVGSGRMALPLSKARASIAARDVGHDGSARRFSREFGFQREVLAWSDGSSPTPVDSLIVYAQVDGSFSLWDPARNPMPIYARGNSLLEDRPRGYVFSATEVWDGLKLTDGTQLCNGLILDWVGWQKENGEPFVRLKTVLEHLSIGSGEVLRPGKWTRVSLDDVRDIPTLGSNYGQEVPVVFASAGVGRVISLAYLLVWSWEEHTRACALTGRKTANSVLLLIDEIESHLHPRWQRTLLQSLLSVINALSTEVEVQLITATHSPLVMASAEPWFDPAQDAWFDLDLVRDNGHSNVTLTKRPFQRRGGASRWLQSEAFDLPEDGSLERERALLEARELLADPQRVTDDAVRDVDRRLRGVLSEIDPFWIRWSAFAEPFVLKSP